MTPPTDVSPPRDAQRSAGPQRDVQRRHWWIGIFVLLILAGAGGIASLLWARGSNSAKPVGGHAAARGNAVFNRAASGCVASPGDAARTEPGPGAQPPLVLGLSAAIRLYTGRAQCAQTRLARATGVHWLREDLSWAQSEPRPNRYNWSGYDAVIRTAVQAGMTVLPILDDPPSWAAPTSTSLPTEPGAYAAFVAAAVSRYGPGGSFWQANPRLPVRPIVWYELWNEPYFASGNRDPGVYARLVRAAVVAGRAANPAVRFLIEAAASYQTSTSGSGDWIGGMYAAVPNLGSYYDGLAVHPYGGDPATDPSPGDMDTDPVGEVDQVHQELVAHGDGSKPLWVTEIGWSTCAGADLCVTEAQQASYLRTFLSLAGTAWKPYVRAVFVYALRDSAPHLRSDREAWYGLLRPRPHPQAGVVCPSRCGAGIVLTTGIVLTNVITRGARNAGGCPEVRSVAPASGGIPLSACASSSFSLSLCMPRPAQQPAARSA